MKKLTSSDENPHEARALARFAAVQAVVQARQNGSSLTQALHHAAQQSWDGRLYSPATIEDWLYRYQRGQFAALQNQPRCDRGKKRALDPAALAALLNLRREHPLLTVKALTEELVRQGVLERGTFSASTLHRRLAEAGLDRQSLRAGSGLVGGPTKAFELPLPNLLWMADCMHGPSIKTEGDATQRAFLFALIDDCSRLCVHGQFYAYERLEGFLDTLRQAVQTRGLPDKLYTDNGAAFRSQHLGIVCANLGIRLLHCKPYHSWSKGKIERFFLTVQMQFQPTLLFEPVRSLDALNRRFWQWLETEYHQREHAALAGESPAQRFARLGTALRLLAPNAQLDRLFLMRVQRRVRKDATFSLGGQFWEVAPHLRGQIVTVHFDPIGYSRVEIVIGERVIGHAIRCNKQRNGQILSSNDYDHDAF
ncbi:MAG TPA: DDE-type integrase/transposase/recombinase [Steroidobacteraceae bacterium]|nr:DDE-type integrase/transposase/recombinase [Steroidobacteraceae bacterium]